MKTYQLIKSIVDAMEFNIPVYKKEGYKLYVCNTLTLKVGSLVLDEVGNQFLITEISPNKWIVAQPSQGEYLFIGMLIQTTINTTYLQGKAISANNEYLKLDDITGNKTPLIWLVRGYTERVGGLGSSIALEVEPVIYFLDQANVNEWTNDQHDSEAINPMSNIAELFVETIKKNKSILPVEWYEIKDEPRFGVQYSAERGNKARILSDDLSGVKLRLPLKVLNCCKF